MVSRSKTPWKDKPAGLYPLGEQICHFLNELLTRSLPQRRNRARLFATGGFVVNEVSQALLNRVCSLEGVLRPKHLACVPHRETQKLQGKVKPLAQQKYAVCLLNISI
ncbi:MAG: hypothetical protein WCC87_02660 [Candidatus Korobacteraceae bacterium]